MGEAGKKNKRGKYDSTVKRDIGKFFLRKSFPEKYKPSKEDCMKLDYCPRAILARFD